MGIIGCGGLGVRGQEGDSVIRVSHNLEQTVDFPTPEAPIQQSISQSVSVNVT